jgi:glycosyltransferase involved in cell wall biosynthesis
MSSIAILTPSFSSLDPAYSLTHVIYDQALCLARAGHNVAVFVSEGFEGGTSLVVEGETIYFRSVLPPLSLLRPEIRAQTKHVLRTELSSFDAVFTHDWISHARMLPLYEGLLSYTSQGIESSACSRSSLSSRPSHSIPWYHWVHSAPIGMVHKRDVSRLPDNHKIVYPLACDVPLVAQQFNVSQSRIVTIPHIVDEETLISYPDELPLISRHVLNLTGISDVIQIYPASADRLLWKGVDKLVKLFGSLKAEGHTVCCVILDSWTGRLPRENLSLYRTLMRQSCLTDEEFVFATQLDPEFRCLPRGEVYRLMLASNLCAFPSMGEAFGLVLPEAILAGNLPIYNASLPGAREIYRARNIGIGAEFGSCQEPKSHLPARFFSDLARKIGDGLQKRLAIEAKEGIRGALNMTSIYQQYYGPLLGG